ncbi:hypothetical protein [Mastigocladopsis repens]|uniref:hypothetical protein n=1 Tax=Mastigocladopsis repens TaxID=221287 RepID=UPI0002E30A95|nr:hypothetical protein [Mastigocladopsis repens]
MPDEIQPNPSQAPTHDAQLAAENIASGEEKAPSVDMEADYQAAQQLSVSEIDRTGEGEKAAEKATAPKQEVREPQQTNTEAKPTGNPNDYIDMAKEVGGSRNQGGTNVTDDLLEKAKEKGQPKK